MEIEASLEVSGFAIYSLFLYSFPSFFSGITMTLKDPNERQLSMRKPLVASQPNLVHFYFSPSLISLYFFYYNVFIQDLFMG